MFSKSAAIAILFSSSFCHSVPFVTFVMLFVPSLNDVSPYFYVLLSLVDCEQSLFFFRFSKGSARARVR